MIHCNHGLAITPPYPLHVNIASETPFVKSQAATWYWSRTTKEEHDTSILPRLFIARCQSGRHISKAESEAIGLVLSSYTEPT